jgi:hypothetical protein
MSAKSPTTCPSPGLRGLPSSKPAFPFSGQNYMRYRGHQSFKVKKAPKAFFFTLKSVLKSLALAGPLTKRPKFCQHSPHPRLGRSLASPRVEDSWLFSTMHCQGTGIKASVLKVFGFIPKLAFSDGWLRANVGSYPFPKGRLARAAPNKPTFRAAHCDIIPLNPLRTAPIINEHFC